MNPLVELITASQPATRDQSLDRFCHPWDAPACLEAARDLDAFRKTSDNLYERVRALFFLSALHRYHLPGKPGVAEAGLVPFLGYQHLLNRRFEEAIRAFLEAQTNQGPSEAVSSALSAAYRGLAFQTLADQVRRSVRSVRGNQWMFRAGHPGEHPLRLRPELLRIDNGLYPVLRERTPVRMDLTHSGWSDIFFLGMDYPEGARVINTSINLAVRGAGSEPQPPVEAWLRVIDEPVLRLTSVDLHATTDVTSFAEVFDFARDYLGLLKAALIAAGIIPPGMEGCPQDFTRLLAALTGKPGLGLEVVSQVNGIPKGSRLAVSTNLLASLISVAMRATGQVRSLTGPLEENDRRLVAARAILGEWLGGSGGGWQDSGGVWPGMKLIAGEPAAEGDPEFGISRGRLLPRHRVFTRTDVSDATRHALEQSLVLVHGGMAQDVGPVLEMVTEKYLLRSEAEWRARGQAVALLDEMLDHLRRGDIRAIGAATQRNFNEPIQTIIPWAGNLYTDTLIARARAEFGDGFWGFWMLGGMAGGGMGFLFDPQVKPRAQARMAEILLSTKHSLESAVPFAMNPVVYDFTINETGTAAELLPGLMPPAYYSLHVPALVRRDLKMLPAARRTELETFAAATRTQPAFAGVSAQLVEALLPGAAAPPAETADSLDALLAQGFFDRLQHERIRTELRAGRIGLAQNRLPVSASLEDARPGDVVNALSGLDPTLRRIGEDALRAGAVGVISLAGGAGSRWTRGAGVVKALNPFARFGGKWRNFIEVHLAKSRRTA
ncbi:MAG: UTP--glucose-1-phosphate uridylyltransferase, partial [Bryobacter sp.]|nr:UTP--glucose-1-phosphate uridylyltransferase [Bryobacter sp.]